MRIREWPYNTRTGHYTGIPGFRPSFVPEKEGANKKIPYATLEQEVVRSGHINDILFIYGIISCTYTIIINYNAKLTTYLLSARQLQRNL
jgi:hypothetical protein